MYSWEFLLYLQQLSQVVWMAYLLELLQAEEAAEEVVVVEA